MKIEGKVIKYGNNVNTDEIIPAKYLNISDPELLGKYCFSGLDKNFIEKVNQGRNIIVAGDNFGCGSSREHAAVSIKASGIKCIIAESFARIFFRNSINIGLPIVELKYATEKISFDDELKIDFDNGKIENITKKEFYDIVPFPIFMKKIIDAGGLIQYLKTHRR